MRTSRSPTMMRAFILLFLAYPVLTNATPMNFDCDVPPDHYSSVSKDVSGAMIISGSVEPVQLRSGNNLPVVGARLVSADGRNSAGFQLVAESADAKQFDVVLNIKRGDNLIPNTVGHIETGTTIPFALSLSQLGKVTLQIGGTAFNADFTPIPAGSEMSFCSTGQFKFSNLMFTADGEPAISTP